MINDEKRRLKRLPPTDGDAVVEIEHTFGPVPKSVYKIIEYSEFGLSILIPHQDGYYLVGTPVKFSIVHQSIQFRHMYTGVVRYYHSIFMEDGNKYYKIGIEIVTTYRDLQNKKLNLRAERVIPPENYSRYVRVKQDNRCHEFTLADVSKYSAAFFCEEAHFFNFGISSTIEIDSVSINNCSLYKGTATIIRVYKDNKGKNRVVFQPRNELINVSVAVLQNAFSSISTEINEVIALQNQYSTISERYKTAVADLRSFLENVHRVLDGPKYQVSDCEAIQLLQLIFPDFFVTMDSQITIIDDIIRELSLSQEHHLLYKNYYQRNLLPLLLQSPINKICYFKPNGYPGDFEMMRLTQINAFDGPTLFSKILSKYTTSCHLGEVARKRTQYLENFLYEYLKNNANKEVNIFSIASGPAIEIQDLISHHPEVTANVTFTLLDQEIKALQHSMDSIFEKKIRNNSNVNIKFIHDNLQNHLHEITQKELRPMYDIVYSFGLFDYFDKYQSRFIINSLKSFVKPGGTILIANVSLDNNKCKILLEYAMDWYLIYRNQDELRELAKGNFLFNQISIDEIENGSMKFLKISL
jgi:extracellular factor (EF) 3-hydroxypalmitic acid methyl ester biosynthesis protein